MDTIQLVKTELEANNNKFWKAARTGLSVQVNWGRVGDTGQSQVKDFSSEDQARAFIQKKAAEKEKKGYQKLSLATGTPAPVASLAHVAKKDIAAGDPELQELVERLVQANKHTIESGTTIKFNSSTGLFQTPLGIVDQETVDKARRMLYQVAGASREYWDSDAGRKHFASYLMLIPQDVGRRRPDPMDYLGTRALVDKQLGILDALEGSLAALQTPGPDQGGVEHTQVFKVSLRGVQAPEKERIRKLYQSTRKTGHTCRDLDVSRAWELDIQHMTQAFQTGKQVGNVKELWHGTSTGNLLSILHKGLIIPKSYTNGWACGPGVYFSDISTKSLGYSYGYWAGTRDEKCYMLLNLVAMGREYITQRANSSGPPPGYDSFFLQGGGSFVNNELIVYKLDQICPVRLVEFTPHGK